MTEKQRDLVPNEDGLLRGVPPEQWDAEGKRPFTAVLNTDDLSTDWEKYRSPDQFLDRHGRRAKGHGLIRFKAGFPRRHDLPVEYDPNPHYEPDNEAHTIVKGSKPKAFYKAVKRLGEKDCEVELICEAVKAEP